MKPDETKYKLMKLDERQIMNEPLQQLMNNHYANWWKLTKTDDTKWTSVATANEQHYTNWWNGMKPDEAK